MGCDIHAWIEYKNGSFWECFGTVEFNRNYCLFGALAGVRERGIEHIPPKGWTEAVSFEAGYFREDGDRHSHSWLTIPELEKARQIFVDATNKKFRMGPDTRHLDACIAAMKILGESRLIFNFDN